MIAFHEDEQGVKTEVSGHVKDYDILVNGLKGILAAKGIENPPIGFTYSSIDELKELESCSRDALHS